MGKLKNKSSKIIKLEKKAAKIIVYSLIIYSLLGYLLYRIFALQIIDGPKLSLEAFNQSRANNLIKPKRGTIYDRTGKTLAASVPSKHRYRQLGTQPMQLAVPTRRCLATSCTATLKQLPSATG